MLPALLAFLTQIVLLAHFLMVIYEVAAELGKLSPNNSPLSEPESMLVKIYSEYDSAPKAFHVSDVTINSAFSRTGGCLSHIF